jgi:hypothetical protein
MIEMASKRNRAHADKARFVASPVEDAELGDEQYDKVFAVHVAVLEKPGRALDVVRSRLAPGGSLHVFSQAPGWKHARQAEEFGAEVGGVLEGVGLAVEDPIVRRVGKGFAVGVVARAPAR